MMKVFAVRDAKADAFGGLTVVSTKGLALRGFADAVADERSEFSKYPDDYMLYELGTYDPNSGELTSHRVPELVVSARSIVDQLATARKPRESVEKGIDAEHAKEVSA